MLGFAPVATASASERAVERRAAGKALGGGQPRPAWSAERMASHHEHLPEEIERDGADVLRRHLRDGFESVAAATGYPRARALR